MRPPQERSLILLRAVIFDFDGVIVDSEPLILRLTQQMAAQEGWRVSREEYYREYLALDDRAIVEHLYRSHGQAVNAARREELVRWKAKIYLDAIRHNGLPAMPGAVNFVRQCSARYPLAIASGSLRQEVECLLEKLGLRGQFRVLATADDCDHSKPDPAVYRMALAKLRAWDAFRNNALQASGCLAIEDAPAGVDAAHAAGMKCMALAHSRPMKELRHADWVFHNFADASLQEIARGYDLSGGP